MKRIVFPVIALLGIAFTACNSSGEKSKPTPDSTTENPKTPADSLMSDVLEGHDASMSKMGKLDAMQQEVQKVLDSIAKLPGKTKTMLAPYKTKMERALEDLKSAKSEMEIWMDTFNMDSALNNMEQRLKYLRDEKLKISGIKENILHSLQKADSLIKSKL
jgi:hypothetical protein